MVAMSRHTNVDEVALVLDHVRKEFNGFIAVDGVDLVVNEGEFVCFLGPSGCGKTTTLRMIAGLELPTEGEIYLFGRRVTYLPPQERGVGFVFQNYALFWHMTVYENIAFGLKIRGMPKSKINQIVRDIAARLELEEFLNKKAAILDLSTMQRVALARTLVTEPKILLLDEPLNNIRPGLREIMRADLKRMQKELGRTMIFVTHDQEEALTLGDRVVVMNQGKIMQVGSPLDLFYKPANTFVAGFIGRPPMNIIPVEYEVSGGQGWLVWREANWRLAVKEMRTILETKKPKDGLLLGIRPEHVRVNIAGGGLPAKVEVVQPLGRKVIVTLEVAGYHMFAVIFGEVRLAPGMSVNIDMPSDSVHLFHKDTGEAIAHGIC